MAVSQDRRLAPTPALLFALLLVHCGGGGTDPSIPSAIALAPTVITFTAVGQTQQLSAAITDQHGNPVDQTSVNWSSNNPAVATVSATGLVTSMGEGTTQVTAAVGEIAAIATVTVTQTSGYNITIRYLSTATTAQQQAFTDAKIRWESLITGDVPDLQANAAAGTCGENSPAISELVDDLLILVTVDSIDGPGAVLGVAGPCYIRVQGDLTVVGRMTFDEEDLEDVQQAGALQDLILHEMGHVLGIGTLWSQFSLLQDPALADPPGTDPHFTGMAATAAFDAAGGTTYISGQKVPVEETGGAGTADGHWRESVLGNELMTGYVTAAGNPLSAITVQSLADMGYAVDQAAADPFSFLAALRAAGSARQWHLKDDIAEGPIYRLGPTGRVVGVATR